MWNTLSQARSLGNQIRCQCEGGYGERFATPWGGFANNESNDRDTLFDQLDADGDGNVSRDEVKAKYSNKLAASTTIFDRLDTDENGVLSRQELRRLSAILGR